ncbi:hypothetical protein OA067_00950 [Gammaproteobacteria bacterium]|nr:hypothetical protein [Gammaproteobacteria bacterium]
MDKFLTRDLLQKKTSALWFHLEKSLGDWIYDRAQSETELEMVMSYQTDGYFMDGIEAALEITKDSEDYVLVKELKAFIEFNSLADARNFHGHPNRDFEDWYFYRVASLCCHPNITKLGLDEVYKGLISIEAGTLAPVPDEYFELRRPMLPNNIPQDMAFDKTDLIGRKREKGDLKKRILNPRIFYSAITGPGGAGKTSLLVDCIRDLALEPASQTQLDAIVWVSFKEEFLEADGIKVIPNVQTELEPGIIKGFKEVLPFDGDKYEHLLNAHDQKKVLLCLDNLETLLRDNSSSFDKFQESLPSGWMTIVTSRIPPDSANTLALKPLVLEQAVLLARKYANYRGFNPPSSGDSGKAQDYFEKICQTSQLNPLAIRLLIDSLLLGWDWEKARSKTGKLFSSFSFSTILESLPSESINVLEILNQAGTITRRQLMSVCSGLMDADSASMTLSKLVKTSLVHLGQNEDDEEIISIDGSVAQIIRTDERHVEARAILLSRQQKSNEDLDRIVNAKPPWVENFVDSSWPEEVKELAVDWIRDVPKSMALRPESRTDIKLHQDYDVKIKNMIRIHGKHFELLRINAMNSHCLNLQTETEELFEDALKAASNDFERIRVLKTTSRHYARMRKYLTVVQIQDQILQLAGGLRKIDLEGAKQTEALAKRTKLLNLVFADRTKEVLEETAEWKSADEHLKWEMGTARTKALKVSIEQRPISKEKYQIREEIIEIMTLILEATGTRQLSILGKLLEDFISTFLYELDRAQEWSDRFVYEESASRIFLGLEKIFILVRQLDPKITEPLISRLSETQMSGNPFLEERWVVLANEQAKGYPKSWLTKSKHSMVAEVKHPRPIDEKTGKPRLFLFLTDPETQEDYFMHRSALRTQSEQQWLRLEPGDEIAILNVKESAGTGKYAVVDSAEYVLTE